jgi:hypothetical protein
MRNYKEILTCSISDLPLGNEIRNICNQHGIKNLDGLLEISDYDMIHKLGFSYHAVMELYGYLQLHGLGDLMENSGKKTEIA